MRQRTIKPAWLDDEKLASLSSDARLLSIGLILLADDWGCGRASATLVRNKVWAYSDPQPTVNAVQGLMVELGSIGYLVRYEVRGQLYYWLPSWSRHQKIDRPSNTLRNPTPNDKGACLVTTTYLLDSHSLDEPSTSPRETLALDRSGVDRIGGEGSVRGKRPRRARSLPKPKDAPKFKAEIERLWELQNKLRKESIPRVRDLPLSDERRKEIAKVLDSGYSEEDCECVLRWYAERATRDKAQRQWFNGETHWRLRNFERTLGMVGSTDAPASFADTASIDAEELEYQRRKEKFLAENPEVQA